MEDTYRDSGWVVKVAVVVVMVRREQGWSD